MLIASAVLVFGPAVAPALSGQELWRVRGTANMSDGLRVAIAQDAKPNWHDVPLAGSSLRLMLQQACGTQSPVVDGVLQKRALEVNGLSDLDQNLPGRSAVLLPLCLKVEKNVSVHVRKGDTVDQLLRTYYGHAEKWLVERTYELNKSLGFKDVDDFVFNLPAEKHIILPYSAPSTTLTWPTSAWATCSSESQGCMPILNEYARLEPKLVAPPATRDPREFEYVQFVTAADAQGCTPVPGEDPPFDLHLLKTRFAIERQAAAQYVPDLTPALIGVIDSGISGVDSGVFQKRFLRANPRELNGAPLRDDDLPENNLIDDIYGMNFNGGTDNGSVRAYTMEGVDWEHGTKIGTLTLGGRAWVDAWGTAAPWAQLKLINFSSSSLPHPVDAANLEDGIEYLLAQDVRIVNLSLSNRQRLVPLNSRILSGARTLFVTASGNTSAGGADLAVEPVFPAADGGEGALSPVLLTVGAHNPDGSWAPFSNYSERFVDLLAPGCGVATLNAAGAPVKENGTSVATAIVSFAAGLIGGLGETSGKNLKTRLLISADIDSALVHPRTHRPLVRQMGPLNMGRLNIVKAISLSNDVVETGSRNYSFGRLMDRDALRAFCDDDYIRSHLDGMRRVRPNIKTPQGTQIEYWIERSGILSQQRCSQINSAASIGDFRVDGTTAPGPALQAVHDIVLADRKQP